MSPTALSVLTVLLLLLLGAWVVHQARRSRESELGYRLTRTEIALHDAEQSLQNTVTYYREEVARLTRQLRELEAGAPVDDRRFRQAKAAFARMYHPDGLRPDAPDRHRRTEMFREYWEELQRIEAGR